MERFSSSCYFCTSRQRCSGPSLWEEIRKSATRVRLRLLDGGSRRDSPLAAAAQAAMVATASSAAADISSHVESVHPQFSATTEPVHNTVGVAHVRLGSDGSTGNRSESPDCSEEQEEHCAPMDLRSAFYTCPNLFELLQTCLNLFNTSLNLFNTYLKTF